MTGFNDSAGEIHRRDLTEELIDELTADTPAGTRSESLVTEFLLELRSQYDTSTLPQVRTPLAEFVDVGLSNRSDLPTAGSPILRRAAHPPVLPALEPTTRRIRVPSYIASVLGTVTGKIVLGAAVAAASVGGAQATGAIDIPTLPSPDDDPDAVETDDTPVSDIDDDLEADIDDSDLDDDELDDDDGSEADDDLDDADDGDVSDGPEIEADDDLDEVDDGGIDDGQVGDVEDGPEAEADDGRAGGS